MGKIDAQSKKIFGLLRAVASRRREAVRNEMSKAGTLFWMEQNITLLFFLSS
jgi:hypothetical protein